jgi:chromosome segregation ATPase
MSTDPLTISEVVALFDVSEATVKRDRKAGTVEADKDDTGRQAPWLYRRSSLEARYSMRDNVPEPDDPDHETVLVRIVELELRADYDVQELARVKAERDQARNDLEHERGELARSQADIGQGRIERGRLEAQAEAVQAIADERQARIEALDAHTQELLERADNAAAELRDTLNNVTWRYRRKLRKAQAAQTPPDAP